MGNNDGNDDIKIGNNNVIISVIMIFLSTKQLSEITLWGSLVNRFIAGHSHDVRLEKRNCTLHGKHCPR